MAWHRRCIFGRYGSHVVSGLCAYEIAALTPRSPLPPITTFCRRWPPLGWALWLAFGHHLFLEAVELAADGALDELLSTN